MPKDDERKEMTQEELNAREEKFRTFFSTSVAQVPEEMNRRDEEAAEQHHRLFARLLRNKKPDPRPQPPASRTPSALRKHSSEQMP